MRRALAGIVLAALAATVWVGAQGPSRVPHVVFVTGDDEYRSEITMPMIAAILERSHGLRTSIAYAKPTPQAKEHIEGLVALDTADLMVIFTRFRKLPDRELSRIQAYVDSGKPIVGFRTSTHAFLYPEGNPHFALNDGFALEIFGTKWITHHGHTSTTTVTVQSGNAGHPILRGVTTPFPAKSWLYHVEPLSGPATVLLDGTAVKSEKKELDKYPLTQPVAWTREHKGGRVFFTTLGHPGDFEQAPMRRLVVNGILWALGREVPAGGAEATPVQPYVAPEPFDLSKVR